MNLLHPLWMADSSLHELQRMGISIAFNTMLKDFDTWMNLMKPILYKEEYLHECNGT